MQYLATYSSPLGNILLAADEIGLTGLWFEGQKYFASGLDIDSKEKEVSFSKDAKKWLDIYFSGNEPTFSISLHLIGTDFQKRVWNALCNIRYGEYCTYGDIAREIGCSSAQAVGGAVGHNRISIIVPCHRVVGASGSLTGYAGGIKKKLKLLELEHVDTSSFFIPQKESAL